ncbi:MAG: hypothetical protein HW404_2106, partial [Anaerolineales bacterium]|nr:hypothetical protein [Anaerolineales bacterium]
MPPAEALAEALAPEVTDATMAVAADPAESAAAEPMGLTEPE